MSAKGDQVATRSATIRANEREGCDLGSQGREQERQGREQDATMCAKDATMSANGANMCAKYATISAKTSRQNIFAETPVY